MSCWVAVKEFNLSYHNGYICIYMVYGDYRVYRVEG